MPKLDGRPTDWFASRADTLARLAALAVVLMWAAVLWPLHAPPFSFWQQDALACVAGVLVFAPLLRSRNPLPRSPVVLAAAGLALSLWFARLDAALLWSFSILWAVGVFLGVKAARDRVLAALPWGLLSVAVLAAGVGLWQIAHGEPFAVGPLAQRNLFADAVTLGLVGLAFTKQRPVFFWPQALALSLAVAASGSAAAFLYATALLLLALWHRHRRLMHAAALLLAALVVWRVVAAHVGHAVHTPGAGALLVLWRTALTEIVYHPIGIGIGNTAALYFREAPQHAVLQEQTFNNAHNLFLQVGLDSGLPGMVLALVLFSLLARRLTNPRHVFASSALSVLWIHSLVEFPLWQTAFLGLFAALYAVSDDTPPSEPVQGVPQITLGVGAVVLLCVAAFSLQMRDVQSAFTHQSALQSARTTAALNAELHADNPVAVALRSRTALALARKNPVLIVLPDTWPQSKQILDLAVPEYPIGSLPLEQATVWALTGKNAQTVELAACQAVLSRPADAKTLCPIVSKWSTKIPALRPVRLACNAIQ